MSAETSATIPEDKGPSFTYSSSGSFGSIHGIPVELVVAYRRAVLTPRSVGPVSFGGEIVQTDPAITLLKLKFGIPWIANQLIVHDGERYAQLHVKPGSKDRLSRALVAAGFELRYSEILFIKTLVPPIYKRTLVKLGVLTESEI